MIEVSATLVPSLAGSAPIDLDADADPIFEVLHSVMRGQPYTLEITPDARKVAHLEVTLQLRGLSLRNALRLLFDSNGLGCRVRGSRLLIGTVAELGVSELEAEVAPDGSFHFDYQGSEEDEWKLYVFAAAAEEDTQGTDQFRVRAGGVMYPSDAVRLASPLELDYVRPIVEERILSHTTGLPIAEARVRSQGRVITRSDSKGRVRFEFPWPSQVQVDAEGYLAKTAEAPDYDEWPLYLEPSRRISGLVLTTDGKPVPKATVWGPAPSPRGAFAIPARHSNSQLRFEVEAQADAEGRYTLEVPAHLSAPRFLEAKGFLGGEDLMGQLLVDESSAGTALNIVVQPTEALQGRVLDRDGQPVVGARVTYLACKTFQVDRPYVPTGPFQDEDDEDATEEDEDEDSEDPDEDDEEGAEEDEDEDSEDPDEDDDEDERAAQAALAAQVARDAQADNFNDRGSEEVYDWDAGHTDVAGRFVLRLAPPGALRLRIETKAVCEEHLVLPTARKCEIRLKSAHSSDSRSNVRFTGLPPSYNLASLRAYPAGSVKVAPPARHTARRLGADPAEELRRIRSTWLARTSRALPDLLAEAPAAPFQFRLQPGPYDLIAFPDDRYEVGAEPLVLRNQHLPGGGKTLVVPWPKAQRHSTSIRCKRPPGVELTIVDSKGAWVAPPSPRGWPGDYLPLEPGRYTVQAHQSGFEPQSFTCALSADQVFDLGEISLVAGGRSANTKLGLSSSHPKLEIALLVVRDPKGRILQVVPSSQVEVDLGGLPTEGALQVDVFAWGSADLSGEGTQGSAVIPEDDPGDESELSGRIPLE